MAMLDEQKYKIKIGRVLNLLLIIIFIFAEYKYFCLPPSLQKFYVRYNIASNQQIKLLLSMILLAINIRFLSKVPNGKYFFPMLTLLFLLIFSAGISVLYRGNLWTTQYKFINLLILPFGYMAISMYMQRGGSTNTLGTIITLMNIVCCLIFIFQSIEYSRSGHLFLTINWANDEVYLRHGNLRITECMGIIAFSFCYSVSELFEHGLKSKPLHLINAAVSAYEIVFVTQTRSVIVICGLAAVIVFLMKYKVKTYWDLLAKTLITLVGVYLALLVSQDFGDIVRISTEEKSYVARSTAYSYYIPMIKKLILSGYEFVDFSGSSYFNIIHGSKGLFYPSDVGMIGCVVKFGLLTGIWYFVIIASFIWQYITRPEIRNNIRLMIILISIGTSLTLSLMDYERFVLFIMMIIFFEFSGGENSSLHAVRTNSQKSSFMGRKITIKI